MSEIEYTFIDIEIPDFDPEFFSLWISGVVKDYNKKLGPLSYIFCSDEYLLKMNKEHLNHDYYTDIITFNYNDGDVVSGDMFISYERVIDNAESFGNSSVYDELCRVMVHGVLHLLGFNDKSEKEELEMREEETKNLIKR